MNDDISPSLQEEQTHPHEERRSHHGLRRHWRKLAVGVMICIVAIITPLFFIHLPRQFIATSAAVGNAQRTVNPLVQATPTPTIPLQPLPCHVNLRTWTDGSADWQNSNGLLVNNGTKTWNERDGPTIVAPCDVSSASAWSSTNVAIEARIQVTGAQNNACFGVTVRGNTTINGWQGYKAGVGNCLDNLNTTLVSGPDYLHDAQAHATAFSPGTVSHTYRIEMQDTTIRLFIDGKLLLNVSDTRYLTGAEIGLWCQHIQLTVTRFSVTALDNN